jgi:hypothetical protein
MIGKRPEEDRQMEVQAAGGIISYKGRSLEG